MRGSDRYQPAPKRALDRGGLALFAGGVLAVLVLHGWSARGQCPLELTPQTLPAARVSEAYGLSFSASGGTPPYTFTVVAGSLPPGVILTSGGIIAGTPGAAGFADFTVDVVDATASCTVRWRHALVVERSRDFVTGEGLGDPNPNRVRVALSDGRSTISDFHAYGAGRWGVNVAPGGIDGDGHDEILTGPGPGAIFGPHVRAFAWGGTPVSKVSYYAYGTLRYGVNVGGAELDADGFDEIVTGAGPGQVFGPHVRGFQYDGAAVSAIAKLSFFAYGTLRYGVNVASGDVDGDGVSELLTGAGPSAVFAPIVRGFDYDGAAVTSIAKINFDAFPGLLYGANVAGGDADGDAFGEIAASPGPGPSSPARFLGFDYDGAAVAPLAGFDVSPYPGFGYGGRVALGQLDGGGGADLVTGAGRDPAADATVHSYDYQGAAFRERSSAFTPFADRYGVNSGVLALGAVAPQRIAIPSYFYPCTGTPGCAWDQLDAAAPIVGLAIINPNSGPGTSQDPSYVAQVRRSHDAGVVVIGYVSTSYGARPLAQVQADVLAYYSWYAVDGIFFDEATTSCTTVAYYQALHDFVKAAHPTRGLVVLNPGTNVEECYVAASDVLINFEDRYGNYVAWQPSGWETKYPRQWFWHLVLGASPADMAAAMSLSKDRHAGLVYVTPDDLPNPWDTMPPAAYWTQELALALR